MNRTRFLLCIVVCLLQAGCTARNWYQGNRAGLEEQCRRLVNEAEYQRCMADARLSYEDYQRRREGTDTPDTMRR